MCVCSRLEKRSITMERLGVYVSIIIIELLLSIFQKNINNNKTEKYFVLIKIMINFFRQKKMFTIVRV